MEFKTVVPGDGGPVEKVYFEAGLVDVTVLGGPVREIIGYPVAVSADIKCPVCGMVTYGTPLSGGSAYWVDGHVVPEWMQCGHRPTVFHPIFKDVVAAWRAVEAEKVRLDLLQDAAVYIYTHVWSLVCIEVDKVKSALFDAWVQSGNGAEEFEEYYNMVRGDAPGRLEYQKAWRSLGFSEEFFEDVWNEMGRPVVDDWVDDDYYD